MVGDFIDEILKPNIKRCEKSIYMYTRFTLIYYVHYTVKTVKVKINYYISFLYKYR